MCDTQQTAHLDELFSIRESNINGQPNQGVSDIQHTVHSNELFGLGKRTSTVQLNKMCVIRGKQARRLI